MLGLKDSILGTFLFVRVFHLMDGASPSSFGTAPKLLSKLATAVVHPLHHPQPPLSPLRCRQQRQLCQPPRFPMQSQQRARLMIIFSGLQQPQLQQVLHRQEQQQPRHPPRRHHSLVSSCSITLQDAEFQSSTPENSARLHAQPILIVKQGSFAGAYTITTADASPSVFIVIQSSLR